MQKKSYLTLIIVFLFASVAIKTIAVMKFSYMISKFLAAEYPHFAFVGGSVPQELPGKYGAATMEIKHPDTHYPLNDNDAWAVLLLPPDEGFIRLGPKGRPFALSMYHQLHCLNALRYAHVAARLGLVAHPEDRDMYHDNHCLNYIRQGLLCRADNSLPPINSSAATQYRCQDWTKVRNFVKQNRDDWDGVPLTHAWEEPD
ncbi:uncharacterized protein EV420DRAFT_862797 [Desarmillaria tabescens]|uniref:Oxidase ustYa n=1 Tax=Armillaria tabescens TaxID=1929756 RepID=A0AA39MV72_ARMTA|nr:uncharacterized protein EV420DRAFT_862797 [Desarmillaria tabescens]KAK0447857.1 hypothetical protein EV420DRAFT_862797 [Desarmillaria tabescens]